MPAAGAGADVLAVLIAVVVVVMLAGDVTAPRVMVCFNFFFLHIRWVQYRRIMRKRSKVCRQLAKVPEYVQKNRWI
jgi:hypothetical protein